MVNQLKEKVKSMPGKREVNRREELERESKQQSGSYSGFTSKIELNLRMNKKDEERIILDSRKEGTKSKDESILIDVNEKRISKRRT
jgi:hypothetical protein